MNLNQLLEVQRTLSRKMIITSQYLMKARSKIPLIIRLFSRFRASSVKSCPNNKFSKSTIFYSEIVNIIGIRKSRDPLTNLDPAKNKIKNDIKIKVVWLLRIHIFRLKGRWILLLIATNQVTAASSPTRWTAHTRPTKLRAARFSRAKMKAIL